MEKPYPEQKWLPRSKSDARVEKTPALQEFTTQVSLIKQFILDFGLIILVVSSLGLVISEVLRVEVILEAIEVPEDVQKLGYTGKIVAEQLADAALEFDLETRELSSQNSWHNDMENLPGVDTDARIKDISLPGSSFTIRYIARFLRQELGLHSDYVRGEIVHENNGLKLTLRNLSVANVPAVHLNKDNIEELIKAGGAALLQLTSPSVLAVNAFHKFKSSLSKPDAQKAAEQQFQYCLKYLPTTDDALVLTLWGITLENPDRPDEAIEKYRRATEADSHYAIVYNIWGAFLNNLKHPEEAIEQFRKAIAINPKYAYAHNNLGIALIKLKRYEEAVEQYRKAIEIDPKYANARNNLGIALSSLERYEEAIEQFRKAIEINPKHAKACTNWDIALRNLKQPYKTTEEYNHACVPSP
jgi:tetratricopeptide (TPR) repeat protein